MKIVGGKSMTKREQEKQAWLRKVVGPDVENIYIIPDFKPNGAGPAWLPQWIKDFIEAQGKPIEWEATFDYHDYQYTVGGTEVDRLVADRRMLRLLLTDAPKFSFWPDDMWRWWRWRRAAKACYWIVRELGASEFSYKPEAMP